MQTVLYKDCSKNALIIEKIVQESFEEYFIEESAWVDLENVKKANIIQLEKLFDGFVEEVWHPDTVNSIIKSAKIRYGCNKWFGISKEAKRMLILDVYKELHRKDIKNVKTSPLIDVRDDKASVDSNNFNGISRVNIYIKLRHIFEEKGSRFKLEEDDKYFKAYWKQEPIYSDRFFLECSERKIKISLYFEYINGIKFSFEKNESIFSALDMLGFKSQTMIETIINQAGENDVNYSEDIDSKWKLQIDKNGKEKLNHKQLLPCTTKAKVNIVITER